MASVARSEISQRRGRCPRGRGRVVMVEAQARWATIADLMPKIVFEQRVLDRVRATRDRMAARGGLLPKETLRQYLQRFCEKRDTGKELAALQTGFLDCFRGGDDPLLLRRAGHP